MSKFVRVLAFSVLLLCSCAPQAKVELASRPAVAPTQPGSEPALSKEQTARRVRQLYAETVKLFQAGEYAAAAENCRQCMHLLPTSPIFPYNLSCALARLDKTDQALEALAKAVELGYADPDHMQADEDLASLRDRQEFKQLLDKARANFKRIIGKYEPPEQIEGLRTVEGDPDGGLRWRLRMSPAATKAKPNRLIIWLHPSGGSMNRHVERMAKDFVARGFALLVFTQKDFRYWSGPQVQKLLKVTLPDVAGIEAIDATRPILFGYSAGGQAALYMWQDDPGRFGALVLDAAYPVSRSGGTPGRRPVLKTPPDDPAIRTAPIFVLVGDQDQGARAWRAVEQPWRDAGVPLVVRYVLGKGHAWLFGKEQIADLHDWLEQLAAGKLPGAPAPTTATAPATQPAREP